MTALQKISQEAKRIYKANPNLSWTDCIKKASLLYAKKKKSAVVKSASKKVKTGIKNVAKKIIDSKYLNGIGDFKKNRAEFVEAKTPKKPRKKRTRSANVYSVSRTATGRFKKKGMKQTHAERYSVRIAGVGAVKKPVKSSTHKDTKSHNVRISVMSGNIGNMTLDQLKRNTEVIERLTNKTIPYMIEELKYVPAGHKSFIKGRILEAKKYVATLKKQNTALKKHIK